MLSTLGHLGDPGGMPEGGGICRRGRMRGRTGTVLPQFPSHCGLMTSPGNTDVVEEWLPHHNPVEG